METQTIAQQERAKNEAAQAAERQSQHEKAQENLRKIEQRAQEMHKESLQKHADRQRQDMQRREADRQQAMRAEIMQRERDRAADLRDRDRQKTEARKQEDRQQEARAAARAYAMAETRKAIIAQRAQMQEKMAAKGQDSPAADRMMAGSVKGPTMRPGSETERGQVVMAVEMDHPGLTDTQKLIIRNQMGIQPGEGWQNREADRKAAVREQSEINRQMQRERAREQMVRKAAEVHAHPTTAEQTKQADDRQRFAEDKQAQQDQDMWHKDHSQTPRERDDEKGARDRDANLLEMDDLEKGVNEK